MMLEKNNTLIICTILTECCLKLTHLDLKSIDGKTHQMKFHCLQMLQFSE